MMWKWGVKCVCGCYMGYGTVNKKEEKGEGSEWERGGMLSRSYSEGKTPSVTTMVGLNLSL